MRKGPILAALYPIAMLLLHLALAALCAVGLGAGLYAFVSPWVAALGLLAVPIVLQLFRKFDRSFFAYYLMHDYAFSTQKMAPIPARSRRGLPLLPKPLPRGCSATWTRFLWWAIRRGLIWRFRFLPMCCGRRRLIPVVRR